MEYNSKFILHGTRLLDFDNVNRFNELFCRKFHTSITFDRNSNWECNVFGFLNGMILSWIGSGLGTILLFLLTKKF